MTEGHDKPAKYPLLFHEVSALVLNKVDLLPHTDFDRERFEADFRQLNATAPILPVSCRQRLGLEEWTHWLSTRSPAKFISRRTTTVLTISLASSSRTSTRTRRIIRE